MLIRKSPIQLSKHWKNEEDYEEGERIEDKIQRMTENNEPIKDGGAPMIYTPKSSGVIAAYNIRTDRWEIAQEAMSKAYASDIAKAKQYGEKQENTAETTNTGESVKEAQ